MFPAWVFIVAVTVLDCTFALAYGEVFHAWEVNPAARGLAALIGVAGVVAVRAAGTLAAAVLVPFIPRRTAAAATAFLFTVHVSLLVAYAYPS